MRARAGEGGWPSLGLSLFCLCEQALSILKYAWRGHKARQGLSNWCLFRSWAYKARRGPISWCIRPPPAARAPTAFNAANILGVYLDSLCAFTYVTFNIMPLYRLSDIATFNVSVQTFFFQFLRATTYHASSGTRSG